MTLSKININKNCQNGNSKFSIYKISNNQIRTEDKKNENETIKTKENEDII